MSSQWDRECRDAASANGLALVKLVVDGSSVPAEYPISGGVAEHAGTMAPELATHIVTMVASGPETEAFYESWWRFINGHWTREMPSLPGSYPVRTTYSIEGATPPTLVRRVFIDQACGDLRTTDPVWAGWWWSEPLPYLPAP